MKMQNEKHHNNKGFTLMELMVVVAIMAVMLGASLTTYRVVSRSNVKKATKYVDSFLSLAREKAKTISAYEWNMTIDATGKSTAVTLVRIEKDDENNLTKTVMDKDVIPSNIKIRIIDSVGNATYIGNGVSDVKYASFAFAPLKGGVSRVYFNNDSTYKLELDGGYCDIEAYYGNKKSKTVRLYFVTGKHMEM